MTRVLIFTASYGSGHVAAAAALAVAFREAGADVTVVDHFRELVHPAFARVSHALYSWILRKAPVLWGLGYGLGDRLASESPLTFGMTRVGRGRLARVLRQLAPDVVVTVHATPSAVMSSLREMGEPVPVHTTVVTDFVAHSQWMARHVDRYCVAAEDVKHEYIARGIAPRRIAVTGVPVPSSFERPVDPLEARRELGLSPGRPWCWPWRDPMDRWDACPRRRAPCSPRPGPCRVWSSAGETRRSKRACAGSPRGPESGRWGTPATSGS